MAKAYAVYQDRNGVYHAIDKDHVPATYAGTVVMETVDRDKAEAYAFRLRNWQSDVAQLTRWQRADAAQKRLYGVSYCADYLALISACFKAKWSGCK